MEISIKQHNRIYVATWKEHFNQKCLRIKGKGRSPTSALDSLKRKTLSILVGHYKGFLDAYRSN